MWWTKATNYNPEHYACTSICINRWFSNGTELKEPYFWHLEKEGLTFELYKERNLKLVQSLEHLKHDDDYHHSPNTTP